MAKSYVAALNHPAYGEPVLKRFGVAEDKLLGQGRHSRVYSIDKLNVLRIYALKTSFEEIESVATFYSKIDASEAPFETPHIVEFDVHGDYVFSIEKNLGRSMGFGLASASTNQKDTLIEEYVNVIGEVKKLKVPNGNVFGELMGDDPITSSDWGEYLRLRAERQLSEETRADLRKAITGFDSLFKGWEASLKTLPTPEPNLVHGDIFPGNLMINDECRVSAVIDFSPMTLLGDTALDVVTALIQTVFSHFQDQDMHDVEQMVRAKYPIEPSVFRAYEMFIYLFYAPDPRETMSGWAYENLERLTKTDT